MYAHVHVFIYMICMYRTHFVYIYIYIYLYLHLYHLWESPNLRFLGRPRWRLIFSQEAAAPIEVQPEAQVIVAGANDGGRIYPLHPRMQVANDIGDLSTKSVIILVVTGK